MRAVVLPGIPLEFAKKRRHPHPRLQWQHSYSKDVERADLPSKDDTSVGARSSSIECTLKFDTPSTRVDAEVCVCTSSQLLLPTSRTSTDTVCFSLVDLPCRSLSAAARICSPERRRPWGTCPCHRPCGVRLSRPWCASYAGGHPSAPCPNTHYRS